MRGLYFRNDEIIIEAANFYNHNNQVLSRENLFSLFLLMIYAAEHFIFLVPIKEALRFNEIIIIAAEFIFKFLQC